MDKITVFFITDSDSLFECEECVVIPINTCKPIEIKTIPQVICIDRKIRNPDCFTLSHYLESTLDIPVYIITDVKASFDRLRSESLCSHDIICYTDAWKIFKQYQKQHLIFSEKLPDINAVFSRIQSDIQTVFKKVVTKNSANSKVLKSSFLAKSLENIDTMFTCIKFVLLEIQQFCNPDCITLFLDIDGKTIEYSMMSRSINKSSYNDFFNVSFHSHFINFNHIDSTQVNRFFYNTSTFVSIKTNDDLINFFKRSDGENDASDINAVSSYFYSPLFDSIGNVIGTIHCGSSINNFFTSDTMIGAISELLFKTGEVICNGMHYYQAYEKKLNIKNVFSKFIPETIIDRMFDAEENESNAERKEVCILFSDIRSFTTITEKNTAENVVKFLNNYFEIMVSCIREENGTIDKFIGDAIVAVFIDSEHTGKNGFTSIATRAINAAIKMVSKLSEVDITGLYLPDNKVNNGIGIHCGEAIVGNIGSNEKKAYTVIGNVVGIAEELEGSTKQLKTTILFSDDVRKQLDANIDYKVAGEIEIENHHCQVFTI